MSLDQLETRNRELIAECERRSAEVAALLKARSNDAGTIGFMKGVLQGLQYHEIPALTKRKIVEALQHVEERESK